MGGCVRQNSCGRLYRYGGPRDEETGRALHATVRDKGPPYPSLILWRADDGQGAARAGTGEAVVARSLDQAIPEAVTEALVSESLLQKGPRLAPNSKSH